MINDLHLDGFDWDAGNRGKILSKHGIDPEQIERFFLSGPAYGPDEKHSQTEQRYLAMGQNALGRWLLASFTLRKAEGKLLLRPISVRYMHRKEVLSYVKASQTRFR